MIFNELEQKVLKKAQQSLDRIQYWTRDGHSSTADIRSEYAVDTLIVLQQLIDSGLLQRLVIPIVSETNFPRTYDAFKSIACDAGAVNRLEPFPDAFNVDPEFELLKIESKLTSMSACFIEDFLLGDGDILDEFVKKDPELVPVLNLIERFYSAYVENDYENATITRN